jgi:hypothetical protein
VIGWVLKSKNGNNLERRVHMDRAKVSISGALIALLTVVFMASFVSSVMASGPVAISANKRYFLDSNGQPCFWLGDTEWHLFGKFTGRDADSVCANRARKGMNAIQIMCPGRDGAQETNPYGQIPWLNNNPLTPNEAYWKLVDTIIDIAAKYQITCVPGVFHGNKPAFYNYININNARGWARWVATRYKDKPNIIWSMYPASNSANLAIVREVAAGLAEGDGGKHIITVHPDPAGSASYFQNEAWIAFSSDQTFSNDFTNYTMTVADYARTPTKPVVNAEARYETEAGTTPLDCRHTGYWSCLAGGFYSYGHYNQWSSPQPWTSWINSPGSLQMKVLGDLFRSIQWWKLVPDQTILSGTAGQNAAARSSDGNWVLAYCPSSTTISVNMAKITASNSVSASWYNPKDGTKSAIGSYANSGTRSFTTPAGWEDAVLLLSTGVTDVKTGSAPICKRVGATAAFRVQRDRGSLRVYAGAGSMATDIVGRKIVSH